MSHSEESFLEGASSLEQCLPDSFAQRYELLSCLRENDSRSVWLAKERESGRRVVIKHAHGAMENEILSNENKILHFLEQQRKPGEMEGVFPQVLSFQEEEGEVFLCNTWVEGMTLEDICESGYRRAGIPEQKSMDYLIRLCEQVQYIHSLHPPIIHRDIKPQNIIVDAMGECHLIDFGISRLPQKNQKNASDTHILGTRITASPEQFGFRQTDERSDIYSLGAVLFFCLTGEYDLTHLEEVKNPELLRIIQKATMFDPGQRYQSAKEMERDLLACRFGDGSEEKKSKKEEKKKGLGMVPKLFLLALLFALAFFLGFGLGNRGGVNIPLLLEEEKTEGRTEEREEERIEVRTEEREENSTEEKEEESTEGTTIAPAVVEENRGGTTQEEVTTEGTTLVEVTTEGTTLIEVTTEGTTEEEPTREATTFAETTSEETTLEETTLEETTLGETTLEESTQEETTQEATTQKETTEVTTEAVSTVMTTEVASVLSTEGTTQGTTEAKSEKKK
ncbi:MAG: serine/threonine protein kinase, partial [Blautia sp.]|nr:serine/threonine protein kinase [Blautia sp.]